MTDIFISYSRDDRDRVAMIAKELEAEGYAVWWDFDLTPGSDFQQVISQNLAEAKCVLAIWSTASISSQWVREEADDGKRRDILVPAMIDDVEIPLGFRMIQAADLRKWKGDLDHPQWIHLVTQVRLVVQGLNPIRQPYRPRIRWGRLVRRRAIDAALGVLLGVGVFFGFDNYQDRISKGLRSLAPEFYDSACECDDSYNDAVALLASGQTKEAIHILTGVARMGEPRHAKLLGDIFSGVPVRGGVDPLFDVWIDNVTAYNWYLFSAAHGSGVSEFRPSEARTLAADLASARLRDLGDRMSTADVSKAERLFSDFHEAGDPLDLYRLAILYSAGDILPKNNVRAATFFILARERGVIEASLRYEMLESLMTRREVEAALAAARDWQPPLPLEHTGETAMMREMARQKKELEELRLMEALPRVSDIDVSLLKRALSFLGHYNGPINDDSDASFRNAVRNYQRAVTREGPDATEETIAAAATGSLSAAQTVNLINEAAEGGHAMSQYTLGVMYQRGIGVIENGALALKWLHLAADQDLALAHYALGVLYRDGTTGPDPVTQDARKALFHFKRSAELGYAPGGEAARLIEF